MQTTQTMQLNSCKTYNSKQKRTKNREFQLIESTDKFFKLIKVKRPGQQHNTCSLKLHYVPTLITLL